jgi:hypothetical protein
MQLLVGLGDGKTVLRVWGSLRGCDLYLSVTRLHKLHNWQRGQVLQAVGSAWWQAQTNIFWAYIWCELCLCKLSDHCHHICTWCHVGLHTNNVTLVTLVKCLFEIWHFPALAAVSTDSSSTDPLLYIYSPWGILWNNNFTNFNFLQQMLLRLWYLLKQRYLLLPFTAAINQSILNYYQWHTFLYNTQS